MLTFVVGVDDGSESLLASSIPDLHFDYFLINIDWLESEIDTDGDHVVLVEVIICET